MPALRSFHFERLAWLGSRSALTVLASLWLASASAAVRPEVLLVFDPADPMSVLDADGIREALVEQQTPRVELEYAEGAISEQRLAPFGVLVLAHVEPTAAEATAIEAWVRDGGGLLASGRAGLPLQGALGIAAPQLVARELSTEVRFGAVHPVATGSYWAGTISQVTSMPAAEMPATVQLLYLDPQWPAYGAESAGARVLARWRRHTAGWLTDDGAPAVLADSPGNGRTVYLGALPGAYSAPAWRYPLAWRTVVTEALAWVNTRGSVIQLGHWPDAHRAAFALSADAERRAMDSVVPALIAMFDTLDLQRFGTVFLVGQAGGDAGTEGAVEHPALVALMSAAGVEVAGHGDVHSRFAGQDQAIQLGRLQTMRAIIESLLAGSGEQMLGFRAPGLAADRATQAALSAAGLAYDSSDQDVWCECTLPYFNGEVWQLPPSSPMDFAVLGTAGLSGGEWERISEDKLDYVSSRRGLFNWVIHPWLMDGRLSHVEALLHRARDRGDLWMRRLDDILYWWQSREALRLDLLSVDATVLRLLVSNVGDVPVEGASIWLRLPWAPLPRFARVDGSAIALVTRRHGLGDAPIQFDVAVVPAVPALGSVVLEVGIDRPPSIFADGFD